jgi:hypothetical protein
MCNIGITHLSTINQERKKKKKEVTIDPAKVMDGRVKHGDVEGES